MDSLIIKGGRSLIGEVQVSGAKNAALPIMACALLTDQALTIHNVPKLTDIYTMKNLLKNHGCTIEVTNEHDKLSVSMDCSNVANFVAPYDIVRKMRASVWVLGPLLARFGYAEVSLPGGCAIGARQIDLHLHVLEAMGAKIEINNGYIIAKSKGRLIGTHFSFNKISVGATINAIMAATLAKGETLLFNCAKEPEIVDLCHCLTVMGAEIEGIGTSELRIIGKSYLHGTSYQVMPDRIEAGTYMIAAAITKGDINIYGINYPIIENLALRLFEAGIDITALNNGVRVKYVDKLRPIDIQTQVYPGFATDLQAQFMSLMTLCEGASVITENIFENRFMHVPELCRMGANITINGNNAIVRGVKFLSGAEVMASDLRASVSLILAGLAAQGETKVRRVYHLDRGYQLLEEKLSRCGAEIFRVKGDTV
jgi:UDP-N-acetylglucosamine 1-carboxyvinyltransferase